MPLYVLLLIVAAVAVCVTLLAAYARTEHGFFALREGERRLRRLTYRWRGRPTRWNID